jgi:lysozyme
MTLRAIDISHYQGTPDFNAVKAAGIALVFVKATQGTTYIDPTFAINRDHARSAGLTVGFYHFANATDPIAEANFFANNVGQLQKG